MPVQKDILYTNEHVWVKKEGNRARVGITQYAQSEIGDILLVELPVIGRQLKAGENFTVVETAKAIFDLKAPVSGKVIETNSRLEKKPELVTQDPYGEGWMVIFETASSGQEDDLMNHEQYEAYIKEKGAE